MADDVVRDIPEEMVEKATFWNERVGRVEPTREGQPLRWWYGPLKASSDPNQKWCHDCYGVVEERDGRRWCRLCKASQPLFDDVVEAGADAATRELAPTWVRYPVGIRSVPDLRTLIVQALSAALAGRTVLELPEPDARRDQLTGAVDVWNIGGWSVTANNDRVSIVTGSNGLGDGMGFYADRARKIAAALIAGADRIDRASGSGVGDQHD